MRSHAIVLILLASFKIHFGMHLWTLATLALRLLASLVPLLLATASDATRREEGGESSSLFLWLHLSGEIPMREKR